MSARIQYIYHVSTDGSNRVALFSNLTKLHAAFSSWSKYGPSSPISYAKFYQQNRGKELFVLLCKQGFLTVRKLDVNLNGTLGDGFY